LFNLLLAFNIILCLLINSLSLLGSICSNTSLTHFKSLVSFMLWFKPNSHFQFKFFELIVGGNSSQINSINSVQTKALFTKCHVLTHHNRMVLQKESIDTSFSVLLLFFLSQIFQCLTGIMQYQQLLMSSIDYLLPICLLNLLGKYCFIHHQTSHTLKHLDVNAFLSSLPIQLTNYIPKPLLVSFLDTPTPQKVTCVLIL
jgi:hypothetical protein